VTFPIKCQVRAQGSTTRVDVYDDIGDGGMFGAGISAKDFAASLAGVSGPLDVHINSYGGSVKDGVAITNAIRDHKGPTRTIVDGMAASAASVIMQAGAERIVQPGAMVMIHDASAGVMGNAADMAKAAAELDKHSDNLASIYAARAGGTPQQWRDAMRAETWYTADEAVDAGLADKVGTDPAALPASMDLAAFSGIPDRIVARLQQLPRREILAGYAPQPYTHESWENVRCPVCGKFSDDDARYCGQCGIELAGRDDVTVTRTASTADAAPLRPQAAAAGGGDAPDCKTCGGSGRLKHAVTGKSSVKCPGCNGTGDMPQPGDDPDETDDPDEGASDAARAHAGTDWLRRLPRRQGEPTDAADIDESDWDGPKAMSMAAKSDDPAATYAQICAGEKPGDKATQDAWALPYRYPGKGPNASGVRNALSRLPQTDDLTNKAAAQALLERLMKQINPDYDGDGAGNRAPSWLTDETAAPPAWLTQTQPAAPAWLNLAKEANQ
jgi:ATP-dependent protease ClpP protease subunit